MLDLYLLRHAKSDWPSEGGPDRDRVLAPRGIRDAGAMGDYMSRSGFLLDTVLCSGAARTRQTLNLITQKWRQEIDIRYSDTLYSGGVQAYLNLARELPETCASAMLTTKGYPENTRPPGWQSFGSRPTAGRISARGAATCSNL
jgi:phosphohistidine phosphatase